MADYDLAKPQTMDLFTMGITNDLYEACYTYNNLTTFKEWKTSLLNRVQQKMHVETMRPKMSHPCTPSPVPLLVQDEATDDEEEEIHDYGDIYDVYNYVTIC